MNALTRIFVALSLLTVAACASPGSAIPHVNAVAVASPSAERVHADTAQINP